MSLIRRILGQEDVMDDQPEDDSSEEMKPSKLDRTRRYRGKIFKLRSEKGYGFISSKEIPFTRIFFHWSALMPTTMNFRELKEGMQVEFNATDTPEKGTSAIKIKVIARTPTADTEE